MGAGDATLWTSLGAALAALAWALVRRVRRAKRLMPKGRMRVEFSIRTPETTDPPPRKAVQVSIEPGRYGGELGPEELDEQPPGDELDELDERETKKQRRHAPKLPPPTPRPPRGKS